MCWMYLLLLFLPQQNKTFLRLFIIKSEGAKDRRISENMNLLKKLKQKCDSTVQNLFANQKKKDKQQQNSNSLSIVQSDALGMTIIDDEFENQSQQEVKTLTPQEWVMVLDNQNLKGYSFTRLYFSFLKGIPTFLRYKIWLFFSTQNSFKNFNLTSQINPQEFGIDKNSDEQMNSQKFTCQFYRKLASMKPLEKQQIQINKDVHRTYSNKKQYLYTSQLLRKVLYALSNSGIQYAQGMNYILLNVMAYSLQSIGITDENLFKSVNVQIEKNIFIIMRQIIIRMDTVFGNNNIFKVIGQLEQKIAQTVPEVLYLIYNLGMDCFSMFSQHYFSLLSYNDSTPELTKLMMDLFFVDGQKAIHAIIVKMLEVSKDKILTSKSPEQLNQYLKKQLFMEYGKVLSIEREKANNLSEFGLSFYESRSLKN